MLPVNPSELTVTREGRNDTVDIVAMGETNLLKTPSLKEIEFESFIPVQNSGGSGGRGGYVEEKATVYTPKFYIDFFEAVQNQKETLRLVITGLDINLEVALESFEYSWEAPDEDMHYSLSFKEYRQNDIKTEVIKQLTTAINSNNATKTATSSQNTTTRQNTPKKLCVGSKVKVNGQLHRDSYGGGPGYVEKNETRKVSILADESRPRPVHVTTLDGGARGWVKRSECEVI
jgi:hypothetical protein